MSTPFTPTLGIKETSKNVQTFVKSNMDTFWDVFKPLIPYILGLTLFDVVITEIFAKPDPVTGEKFIFPIGSILATYFTFCLVISWHRVVIHGPDNYTPMNPLKPKKSEFAFIGIALLLSFTSIISGFIIGVLAHIIGKSVFFLLIPLTIAVIFVGLKIIFYFPSKATENKLTLKQSFTMTKGYIWKILCANVLAVLKILLIAIGFYLVAGLILVGISLILPSLASENRLLATIIGLLYNLPMVLYFQPLMTIIGVTVLSNYYQHAIQNKGIPE